MADGMPPIALDYSPSGAPVMMVEEASAADLAQAMALVPALADEKWVVVLAQVANHLAQGDRYSVIVDPEAFRSDYMAAREAEDPVEAPEPGKMRLRNYGIPDFGQITRPQMEGDTLVFFARNTTLGIPYRAAMPPGTTPTYRPVAMAQ